MKLIISLALVAVINLGGCQWLKDNNFTFSKTDDCYEGSVDGTGSATVCPEKEKGKDGEAKEDTTKPATTEK